MIGHPDICYQFSLNKIILWADYINEKPLAMKQKVLLK